MFRLISQRALLLLVTSCAAGVHPTTAAQHERAARHYDLTADSIESACWNDRRRELTVATPEPCWKAQDVRFLEANRHAAAKHRARAAELRGTSAKR